MPRDRGCKRVWLCQPPLGEDCVDVRTDQPRQILERAFERAGKTLNADKLKAALPRLARTSVDAGHLRYLYGALTAAIWLDERENRQRIARPVAAVPAGSTMTEK